LLVGRYEIHLCYINSKPAGSRKIEGKGAPKGNTREYLLYER